MNKLLAASLIVGSLVFAGCAGQAAGPDTQGSTQASAALTFASESDTRVEGSFVHAGSVVTFVSEITGATSKVTLGVNGASFTLTSDDEQLQALLDGGANALFANDLDALRALEKALDGAGKQGAVYEHLFKTVSLLGGAPRGTTFLKTAIQPKADKLVNQERQRTGGVYNEGITYLCNCAGYVGASQGHEHDQLETGGHGRYTWNDTCGYYAAECEGRCGAGCPCSYNFYYTKDCFDHDICLDNHPSAPTTSTSGDCGNEYNDAYGDFVYGTSSSFNSACNSYAPSDCSR